MKVREMEVRYGKEIAIIADKKVRDSKVAAEVIRGIVEDRPQEVFVTLLLNADAHILGAIEVSVGTLTASLVHPREVFKGAILANANHIIIGHNHPSGSISPSKEDDEVTERITKAGKLLGIRVMDHVIVTSELYHSYAESGFKF